jgi:integrase
VRLSKLQPEQVQAMMNAQLEEGLSPNTVLRIRATLRRALNQAVKWGLISRNPATLVDPPRAEKFRVQPISPQEAGAILKAVADHRLSALFTLALATGLRQGEVLGLRWEDIDFDRAVLTVNFALQRLNGERVLVEPKSKESRRSIPMPDIVVRTLRAHRHAQEQDRIAAGDAWRATGLVFCTTTGGPLAATNVTNTFHRLLERASLKRRRFHDLRHGCASLLLVQGVSMRVVMETLGHSEIGLTMNTYSHVLPQLQREAADMMDDALGKYVTKLG